MSKTCHSAERARERAGLNLLPREMLAIGRMIARGEGIRRVHDRTLYKHGERLEKWLVEWKGVRFVVLYSPSVQNVLTVCPMDDLPLGTNLGSLLSQAR